MLWRMAFGSPAVPEIVCRRSVLLYDVIPHQTIVSHE